MNRWQLVSAVRLARSAAGVGQPEHRIVARDVMLFGVKGARLDNAPLRSGVQQTRCGHTVRVVLTADLSDGHGYSGDVLTVQAGYARNFLIPQKKGLYATPENFERLGMVDPLLEEKEAAAVVVETEEDEQAAEDARAADVLRKYLRNKVLKIWRNVEPSTGAVHPGFVNHIMVRQKLSKQLKIDLEDHEIVQLSGKPLKLAHADMEEDALERAAEAIGQPPAAEGEDTPECQVEIRQLGNFLGKITLRGGHTIPLQFAVVKR